MIKNVLDWLKYTGVVISTGGVLVGATLWIDHNITEKNAEQIKTDSLILNVVKEQSKDVEYIKRNMVTKDDLERELRAQEARTKSQIDLLILRKDEPVKKIQEDMSFLRDAWEVEIKKNDSGNGRTQLNSR